MWCYKPRRGRTGPNRWRRPSQRKRRRMKPTPVRKLSQRTSYRPRGQKRSAGGTEEAEAETSAETDKSEAEAQGAGDHERTQDVAEEEWERLATDDVGVKHLPTKGEEIDEGDGEPRAIWPATPSISPRSGTGGECTVEDLVSQVVVLSQGSTVSVSHLVDMRPGGGDSWHPGRPLQSPDTPEEEDPDAKAETEEAEEVNKARDVRRPGWRQADAEEAEEEEKQTGEESDPRGKGAPGAAEFVWNMLPGRWTEKDEKGTRKFHQVSWEHNEWLLRCASDGGRRKTMLRWEDGNGANGPQILWGGGGAYIIDSEASSSSWILWRSSDGRRERWWSRA